MQIGFQDNEGYRTGKFIKIHFLEIFEKFSSKVSLDGFNLNLPNHPETI